MNRKEWRDKVLKRRSWKADLDDAAEADFNEALNDAQKKLASDCPGAFMPDVEHIVLLPDKTSTSMERTVGVYSGDPYVLSFGEVSAGEEIVTDGTWDWVYHIEVKDQNGVWHRRQCREFFMISVVGGNPLYGVTLDRPWPNTFDTNMEFRLHQPEFYFKDDVTDVLDGVIYSPSGTFIQTISGTDIRQAGRTDYQGKAGGVPVGIVRGRHVQLDAPTVAPIAKVSQINPWVGPEPRGKFQFCYTYRVGRRDVERQDPRGYFEPMLESSPSPWSNEVDLTTLYRIDLSNLPNIGHMLGFGDNTTPRYSHSGIRKAIYVRRTDTYTGDGFIDEVEPLGVGLFLGEVDDTATTFSWDGSVVPVYERRLPEVHGYYAWSAYPHQNDRYELDFRVRRRPRNLETDYDAPRVPPDCEEALVLLGMAFTAQLDNQYDEAEGILRMYYGNSPLGIPGELPKLRRRYAQPATSIQASKWDVPTNRPDEVWWGPTNYFKA